MFVHVATRPGYTTVNASTNRKVLCRETAVRTSKCWAGIADVLHRLEVGSTRVLTLMLGFSHYISGYTRVVTLTVQCADATQALT